MKKKKKRYEVVNEDKNQRFFNILEKNEAVLDEEKEREDWVLG